MVLPKYAIASYSTVPHVNVILIALLSGWTKYMGHLESILGIKYNAFRFDFSTKVFGYWFWPGFPKAAFWSNDNFFYALNVQADLKVNPCLSDKEIFLVYENVAFSPMIEVWNRYYVASGDLGLYIILSFLHEIKEEFKRVPPIIFASQFTDNSSLYEYLLNNSHGIIIYDNNVLDLIIPLSNKITIDISRFANSNCYTLGLMPMSMAWGLGLPYVSSLESGLVTSIERPINIEFSIDESNHYNVILKFLVPIKFMASRDIANVTVDDRPIPKLIVKSCGLTRYVILNDLFLTKGKHKLTIMKSTLTPIIGITKVFIVKKSDYEKAIIKLARIIKNKNLLFLFKFAIPSTSLIEKRYEASFGVTYLLNVNKTISLTLGSSEDIFTAYVRYFRTNKVSWFSRSICLKELNELFKDIKNNVVDFLVLERIKNKAHPSMVLYSFENRNPVNYIIHARHINYSSLIVIFKNKWYPSWKLVVSAKCEMRHFIVHGYANAWYIKLKGTRLGGRINMTVTNTLTILYSLGLVLSVSFALLSCIITVLAWCKNWI